MTESNTTFQPSVFKIPKSKDNISNIIKTYKNDVKKSNSYSQPLFSLGFHSFQHRTKAAMNITENLETKKKFYNIVNNFDPDELKIKETLSSGYYKMWEMLSLFDIGNKDKIVYGAIGEGPGSFVESFIDFREKYFSVKNDKIYSVTLKPEKGENIEDINKQFLARLKKNYSDIYTPHKTSVKNVADKYTGKDNGDITDVKTIKNFKKDLVKDNNLADLITADGSKYIYNEIFKEQESYILIFGEIVAALSVQNKDGDFILKMFDTFTETSVKMIYLLSMFYEDIFIYKPFTSLESEEEKYIVCKKFKFDQKDITKELKYLTEILEKMNTDKFIDGIITKLNIPDDFKNIIKFLNIELINKQQITINKIVTFIKNNNYFGEDYHNYKDNQSNAHKFWKEYFYSSKIATKDLINKRLDFVSSDFKLFTKSLF
jgi:23S rRNA U2552 (ribose-2'-O)-methylase RlmE/FtsJ